MYHFWHRKLTLTVRILQFLLTFTQLTTRLKNFLRGWLLVLGLKEGLVECATVCIKSEVMLNSMNISFPSPIQGYFQKSNWCAWKIKAIWRKIDGLQREIKLGKTRSDTRLTLTRGIEKRLENKQNQIEKRLAHLEGRQNKPDDDYYYGPD